jgi:hypothetical protein
VARTQSTRPAGSHFTEEDWVDFARQQGETDKRARLEQHLDAGCEQCAETLGFWRDVLGLAAPEATYRPPDADVRQVKGQFALHLRPGVLPRLARTAALVFDSLRQPLPMGVRAAGSSPRQLLYKVGRYLIRVQVDSGSGAGRLSVVGQILDEADPRSKLPELPVLLLNGNDAVDRTITNTLGEFELESDPSESLRLSVGIPEIGTLTLPGLLVGRSTPGGSKSLGPHGGSGRRTKARHA